MPRATSLFDLTRQELAERVTQMGERPYRAGQIFSWVYQKQERTFDSMTNLSTPFREALAQNLSISPPQVVGQKASGDGTRKLLLRLEDREHVESVLIPMRGHHTLCISSQTGCRGGCRICLTAKRGPGRNLHAREIVGQVAACQDTLEPGQRITNVVFMGMGEPLDNLENVLKAVRILYDDHGYRFSSRRVTVSTCGLIPGIKRLGSEEEVSLAVSLNAADDETRSRLMPVNRKHPLGELIEALRQYPMRRRRRITFEYVLLKGVNDSPGDADALSVLLRGIRAKVNLIAFNPFPGAGFERPSPGDVLAFQDRLRERGVSAMVRQSKGSDILAACGQLAGVKRNHEGRLHG